MKITIKLTTKSPLTRTFILIKGPLKFTYYFHCLWWGNGSRPKLEETQTFFHKELLSEQTQIVSKAFRSLKWDPP